MRDFAEYPKIPGPFKREVEGPNRNKVILGEWANETLAFLGECDAPFVFTEKVDGTNIRVHWDGHRVEFGGRTDNAQIPAKLVARLTAVFTEELFEQVFAETAVTLYGEGIGAGIQKGGGNYLPSPDFVLFDVLIGGWWLKREDVEDVANKLGIPVVPVVMTTTIGNAVHYLSEPRKSAWGDFQMEGLVGVPPVGLLNRAGQRVMVKVKAVDFLGRTE